MILRPIKIKHGGGKERGGDDDGPLTALFKKWAAHILTMKVAPLDALAANGAEMEPEQHLLRDLLHREFDKVANSAAAARRVIREHSSVPLIRYVV